VTRRPSAQPRNRVLIPGRGKGFLLFFEYFRTVLGPTTPPMEMVAGALYPDFTCGCSTELKNKSGFCACTITFQTQSTTQLLGNVLPTDKYTCTMTCKICPSTLTEVFPCFFLSCKANTRVILAKTGHGPHSSKLVVIVFVLSLLVLLFTGILYYSMYIFILFYVVLCYSIILCIICVYMCTNHCHRVFTQLQFTNIAISISISISNVATTPNPHTPSWPQQ
jgi:hypothetical protein